MDLTFIPVNDFLCKISATKYLVSFTAHCISCARFQHSSTGLLSLPTPDFSDSKKEKNAHETIMDLNTHRLVGRGKSGVDKRVPSLYAGFKYHGILWYHIVNYK